MNIFSSFCWHYMDWFISPKNTRYQYLILLEPYAEFLSTNFVIICDVLQQLYGYNNKWWCIIVCTEPLEIPVSWLINLVEQVPKSFLLLSIVFSIIPSRFLLLDLLLVSGKPICPISDIDLFIVLVKAAYDSDICLG